MDKWRHLREQLLQAYHDSLLESHSGTRGTYHQLKQQFYWPEMKEQVTEQIKNCDTCQRCKVEHVSYPCLLHLEIRTQAWNHHGFYFYWAASQIGRQEHCFSGSWQIYQVQPFHSLDTSIHSTYFLTNPQTSWDLETNCDQPKQCLYKQILARISEDDRNQTAPKYCLPSIIQWPDRKD